MAPSTAVCWAFRVLGTWGRSDEEVRAPSGRKLWVLNRTAVRFWERAGRRKVTNGRVVRLLCGRYHEPHAWLGQGNPFIILEAGRVQSVPIMGLPSSGIMTCLCEAVAVVFAAPAKPRMIRTASCIWLMGVRFGLTPEHQRGGAGA